MKGIKQILTVMLVPLVFHAAFADDASETARAATRRNASVPTTTSRTAPTTKSAPTPIQKTTRSPDTKSSNTTVRERGITQTDTPRSATIRTRAPESKNVSARTGIQILPRTVKVGTRTPSATRTAPTPSRSATRAIDAPTSGTRAMRDIQSQRARTNISGARSATTTQSASDAILNRDFSKCRDVFYDCMDEFCANKDSQLKRCACSTRINEFNSTKKNLAQVEDKLLDFSQRLLTVNMEKEDAMALNQATAGEIAFADTDRSESKKALDEIAKKLNTSFNDSHFDQNLNAISLSLNIDAAFDSVDSLAGVPTTAKSGTNLYAAALPVCREMALEVCSTDDLAIAESSYQMAIEQDCNTVHKSYQTQVDQAREQVFESSALLDISRLDIHQKRNSDDILTCKRKMLDMLTDPTVCGDGLGKCLDTTGRYIDPTTGAAFLTMELANLGTLITRPESDQTWTTAPGNDRFVKFLNTKKQYLAPAMEQCQDISDTVWETFIDDALAQIKLAQDAKLEEMRQSCTTLTTQCLDHSIDSITEFDARALSIFGIAADKTVNAMCTDIQTACTAILQTSGGGDEWETGMSDIATEKTYETILQTCREVGRACIIRACSSISGNFGLCENIDTSINRKSIINRTACWDDVVECVASAGTDKLAQIRVLHDLSANTNSFYDELYGTDNSEYIIKTDDSEGLSTCIAKGAENCIYDICANECANTASDACYTCRLAERIWGNCEVPPTTDLPNDDDHNKIKIPLTDDSGTLLAWFAKNTGTTNIADNCRDTSCGPGYRMHDGICVYKDNFTTSGDFCSTSEQMVIYANHKNCCPVKSQGAVKSNSGNYCCMDGYIATQKNISYEFGNTTIDLSQGVCAPRGTTTVQFIASYGDYNILCLSANPTTGDTPVSDADITDGYPNGKTINCPGHVIFVDSNNHYINATDNENFNVSTYYYSTENEPVCRYNNDGTWKLCDSDEDATNDTTCTTGNRWFISYNDICVATRVDESTQ